MFRGFGRIWKCTKDGTGTNDDTPLVAVNGYYTVQCDRFLPETTAENLSNQKGQSVTDYRFAPYSTVNPTFSPLTIWTYASN